LGITAILGYAYFDERSRINRGADLTIAESIEQTANYLDVGLDISEDIASEENVLESYSSDEAIAKYLAGEVGPYLNFHTKSILATYVASALALYDADGSLITSVVADDVSGINDTPIQYGTKELKAKIAENPIIEFNGKSYVAVVKPIALMPNRETQTIAVVIDKTDAIDAIHSVYNTKINSLTIYYLVAYLVLLCLLFLLVFVVIKRVLNAYVLRPIKQLTQASQAIMDGDLDYPIPDFEDSTYSSLQNILVTETNLLKLSVAGTQAEATGMRGTPKQKSKNKKQELSKVLYWTCGLTALLVVLTISIIAFSYFKNINDENKTGQELVVKQFVADAIEGFSRTEKFVGTAEALAGYSPKLVQQAIAGEGDELMVFFINAIRKTYGAEYVTMTRADGSTKLGESKAPGMENFDFTPEKYVVGYTVSDNLLGVKEGKFISICTITAPSILGTGGGYLYYTLDRTEELYRLDATYAVEKDSAYNKLLWLSILALLITTLLGCIVVWFLVTKFVIKPVTQLTKQADEILNGTFVGKIEVKQNSAYADIQKMLQSGALLLHQETA
jgi:methyl-accepting chemotaxis protein